MDKTREAKIQEIIAKSSQPKPAGEWIMHQTWENLLFMHWPVDKRVLRTLVPADLELDLYNGQAYLTMIPMHMVDIHLRYLPPFPSTGHFPEINLRTYVRYKGKPGIYFLSIDAGTQLGSWIARHTFFLPYVHSEMTFKEIDTGFALASDRPESDGFKAARFSGTYHPVGDPAQPKEGSLDHFLVERYNMFAMGNDNQLFCGEVRHSAWNIQPAKADIDLNTVPQAAGITIPEVQPILLFAFRTDVTCWPMRPVGADRKGCLSFFNQ